jgi:hypothetical protein
MKERRSKTAEAALRAEIAEIAKLTVRERILLSLRLAHEAQELQRRVHR